MDFEKQEAISLLKSGEIETFNARMQAWMEQHPGATFDLEGADLRLAELQGANLSHTNIHLAQTEGAEYDSNTSVSVKMLHKLRHMHFVDKQAALNAIESSVGSHSTLDMVEPESSPVAVKGVAETTSEQQQNLHVSEITVGRNLLQDKLITK